MEEEGDGGFMMMSMGTESNIVITSISSTTNGILLEIGYPVEFTNRLDVFYATDLMERDWQLISPPLETTGSTSIVWLDTQYATGSKVGFYAAGNHDLDSDGDGFSDAFEIFVLGTDPHDPDSHGVYLSGDIAYNGPESGTIYVQAVTESADAWSKTWQTSQSTPGPYTNLVANQQSYWFKSYMDLNGNQQHDEWEPWGIYSATPLYATTDVSGLDIMLEDQPSIWGTLYYSGSATGDIHVLASPNMDWDTTYSTVIPWLQGAGSLTGDPVFVSFPVDYSITGLPQGEYIVRAFIDENGNGQYTPIEPGGQYAVDPIPVSNRVTGISFTIDQDTDVDGIPDWWEMEYFGGPTNAVWSDDPDDDLLNNLQEFEHGTDPLNPDTDGDWFLDGFEVDQGTDPLNPSNRPHFMMHINDDEEYALSTNLLVSIPGVHADYVMIGEQADLSDGILVPFSDPISYGLQSPSNGYRRIFARLQRSAEQTFILQGGIIFDDTPPAIYDVTPTNNHVTDRRWIKVTGSIFDEGSAVRVFVNDRWSHGGTMDSFWYDRLVLEEGTNAIMIVAEDMAGNASTQVVHVIRDTSADVTPPVMELSLPGQWVDGSGHYHAAYGDISEFHFSGQIDDETAQVLVFASHDTGGSGPWPAAVSATQVWARAHLRPGTNVLSVLATDAAGNSSTSICYVVRDTNIQFHITYPTPYQAMNVASTHVAGVASPAFSNATITVNGFATTKVDHGSHISFTTVQKVPLDSGRTELSASAAMGGGTNHTDAAPVSRRIILAEDDQRSTYETSWFLDILSVQCLRTESYFDRQELERWRALDNTHYTFWLIEPSTYMYCTGTAEPCGIWDDIKNCADAPEGPQFESTSNLETPWYPVRFGSYEILKIIATDHPSYFEDRIASRSAGSELQFIYNSSNPDPHYAVIQFPGVWMNDHAVTNVASASAIRFRGRQGFMLDGKVSFIMEIEPDLEYSIQRSDFSWPARNTSAPYGEGTEWWKGRKLSFGPLMSIHPLQVTFQSGTTTNFSPHFGETASLSVKLEPSPPPGGYPGIDFVCHIARKLSSEDYEIIQTIDVVPTNGMHTLQRATDFTWLTMSWSGIPSALDGNKDPATGYDEFHGVAGSFNRKLPAITAGKPVPPPFYYAVAQLKAVYNQSTIQEDKKKIFVPQVVLLDMDWDAAEELMDPLMDGTNVVAQAFDPFYVWFDLLYDIKDGMYAYLGPNVNLRIVTSSWGLTGDYSPLTLKVQHPISSNIWGAADGLDFGNVILDDAARVFVAPPRQALYSYYSDEPPGTVDIPFTWEEQRYSFTRTATHELGHLLGLVSTNPALNGQYYFGEGEHNRSPLTPLDIMNPGTFDELFHKIGRTPGGLSWVFRYVNHDYLRFILPAQ